MKTNRDDRTAIGAILVGTAGALALSMLAFALTGNPRQALTSYDVAPGMTNEAAVGRAVAFAYPSSLRDAGIGGSVEVWIFIDKEGVVQETWLPESSGHTQLDVAALAVAKIIEFTPAMNRDKVVPVWISLPITFEVR